MNIMKYAKSILAGVAAGATALIGVWDGGVTGKEWLGVAVAVLASWGIVVVVPNAGYRYVGKADQNKYLEL